MMNKIPVSVLVVTKNEEQNIGRCLGALRDFAEIIVIDSNSEDRTCEIARDMGAKVVDYQWDGQYPKKRQWCLDTLDIAHDWVFWVDADEVVTRDLAEEIRALFRERPDECGFFVRGRYVWGNRVLKYGLSNNKIALMHRARMMFPVVDDLDIEGMGEIEGHYQPVRCAGFEGARIGQLRAVLMHCAYDDADGWDARHERYAHWEAEMTKRAAWPKDPVAWRQMVKGVLRRSFLKPYIMFVYSYIFRLGFLEGRVGFEFAVSRMRYSRKVLQKVLS